MKIYLPLVLCTFIGVLLLIESSQYPRYSDQKMVDATESSLYDQLRSEKLTSDEASKKFYEIQERYQTSHIFLYDLGLGLTSFGISSIGFLGLLRIRTFGDLKALQSPSTKELLQILGNVTLFLLPFTQAVHFTRLARRGDFPPWADSIGIPIGGTFIFCIILAPILNLIWWTCTRKAKLPVSLWVWAPPAPLWSWCWTSAAGLMVILICVDLPLLILEGIGLTIPLALLALYVTLEMRAAVVSAKAHEVPTETGSSPSDFLAKRNAMDHIE